MRRTAPYPTEFPAGIAMLLVARLHRQRGTLDRALRAIRDSYGPRWALGRNYRYAYLKEEGEIALLVGDTAAAVRAFEGYLRYRVDPDPGPLRAAVDSLRAQVARLTVER